MNDEPFSTYDKVNVLGKGVSHITADVHASEPTIFSISNLVRKLRLEEGGTCLRPTAARAQIPTEGQEGTLALAVLSGGGSGAKRRQQAQSSSPSASIPVMVMASFKTRSATRNKFMLEWFSSSKKDEVASMKSAVKLAETSEPAFLLADPKDGKSAYVFCLNKAEVRSTRLLLSFMDERFPHFQSSTSLYRLTRGKKPEEPIATLPFEAAAVAVAPADVHSGQAGSATLLLYDAGRDATHVMSLQRVEGYRGRRPTSGPIADILGGTAAHVLSCASQPWRLSSEQLDAILSAAANFEVGLATLLDGEGRVAAEPDDAGSPYRLRIASCPETNLSVPMLALDDVERQFEGMEELLRDCSLRLLMSGKPTEDCLSALSASLMSDRLASVEIHYVGGTVNEESGSDRLRLRSIPAERFRAFLADTDWTQMALPAASGIGQRQGTFTLEDQALASSGPPSGSSSCSRAVSAGAASRIPRMSGGTHHVVATGAAANGTPSTATSSLRRQLASACARQEELSAINESLRRDLLAMRTELDHVGLGEDAGGQLGEGGEEAWKAEDEE